MIIALFSGVLFEGKNNKWNVSAKKSRRKDNEDLKAELND